MRLLYNKFGGVILNDASWDYENKKDGVMYSKFISEVLDGGPEDDKDDDSSDEDTKKQDDEVVVKKKKETNSGPRLINGRPVINSRRGKEMNVTTYSSKFLFVLFSAI